MNIKLFLVNNLKCKITLLAIFIFSNSWSQNYATKGYGLYKPHIFWLDWKSANPQRHNGAAVGNGSYSWSFNGEYVVTATISNVIGGITPKVYFPSDYQGDSLPNLYNVDTVNTVRPFSNNLMALRCSGFGDNTSFTITLSVTLDGASVPFPGIIMADGETTGSDGTIEEEVVATTNGTGWRLIDRTTTADPNYLLNISNSGTTATFTVPDNLLVNAAASGVLFSQNATALAVQLNTISSGLQAIAVGLILPFDYGDAPASFGTGLETPAHNNIVTVSGVDLTDGTSLVTDLTPVTVTTTHNLFMGVAEDDETPFSSLGTGADADDNDATDDEDGISLFLPLGTGTTTYSVDVDVSNNSGSPANLCGWIDFNNNGIFENDAIPSEKSCVTNIADGYVGNVTLTWNPVSVIGPPGTVATYGRFRITTGDAGAGFTATIGAPDGEIEDYRIIYSAPLPIVLVDFQARWLGNDKAELTWKISNMYNFSHFEVEYSKAGNFSVDGIVHVTDPHQSAFKFLHTLPGPGSYYYRLKMVDKDGSFSYSPVRRVRIPGNGTIVIGPNPFHRQLIIRGLSNNNDIVLYDDAGKLIDHIQANSSVAIIDTDRLPKGMYLVKVADRNGKILTIEKVLKQ